MAAKTYHPLDKLECYEREYTTAGEEGVPVGPGTHVVFSELTTVERTYDRNPRYTEVTIEAVVKLTAKVVLVRRDKEYVCAGCAAQPPFPNVDGVMYLLYSHDGARLCFPCPGDRTVNQHRNRDEFPVPGWREIDNELYCSSCAEDIDAAKAALRKKRTP